MPLAWLNRFLWGLYSLEDIKRVVGGSSWIDIISITSNPANAKTHRNYSCKQQTAHTALHINQVRSSRRDKMTQSSSSSSSRLQNDFGADLWVRSGTERRHPTAGRGLFAGLQDVKHYNVDHGWAKRSQDQPQGLFSFLWSRFTGGAYRPPTDS